MDLKGLKDKLYKKYDYLLTTDEYEEITSKIIEGIKKRNIKKDIDLVFLKELNLWVNTYISKLTNDKEKLVKVISNYIDKTMSSKRTYLNALKEMEKLTSFLYSIEITLDIDLLTHLVKENDTLKRLLKKIIKEGKLEEQFTDELLLSFIEAYCILYHIEVGENKSNKALLTLEEEKELFMKYKNGDISVRNILIEKNLRLIYSMANGYVGRGLDFDDLVQEGCLGLITAVEKFDPTLGSKFSTYAVYWIRQAITRALSEKSQMIRVPTHVYEKNGKIYNMYMELTKILGRDPTIEELAEKLELPASQIESYLTMREHITVTSLNQFIDEEGQTQLYDFIPDQSSDFTKNIEKDDLREEIITILDSCGLTEIQKMVVLLKYGFIDNQPLSLVEVSKRLGITRERARQIEISAFRRLVNSSAIKSIAEEAGISHQTLNDIQRIRDFYNNHRSKSFRMYKNAEKKGEEDMAKKAATIYEICKEYSSEEVDMVLTELNEEDKKLLVLRYGTDFHHPEPSPEWNEHYRGMFYGNLVPKIRRLLKKSKNRTKKETLNVRVNEDNFMTNLLQIVSLKDMLECLTIKDIMIIYLKTNYFNVDIEKFLQIKQEEVIESFKRIYIVLDYKMNEYLHIQDKEVASSNFQSNISLLSSLSMDEFVMLSLYLGYVDHQRYTLEEISEELHIEIKVVATTIKNGLLKYVKEIKTPIDKEVNDLELQLKRIMK